MEPVTSIRKSAISGLSFDLAKSKESKRILTAAYDSLVGNNAITIGLDSIQRKEVAKLVRESLREGEYEEFKVDESLVHYLQKSTDKRLVCIVYLSGFYRTKGSQFLTNLALSGANVPTMGQGKSIIDIAIVDIKDNLLVYHGNEESECSPLDQECTMRIFSLVLNDLWKSKRALE